MTGSPASVPRNHLEQPLRAAPGIAPGGAGRRSSRTRRQRTDSVNTMTDTRTGRAAASVCLVVERRTPYRSALVPEPDALNSPRWHANYVIDVGAALDVEPLDHPIAARGR